MIKLYTTKIYYLGDLSDKQKEELLTELRCVDNELAWKYFCPNSIYLAYSGEWYEGHDLYEMRKDLDNNYPLINALALLYSNQRIAQIQLRIQELNNELIELDEEIRKLTRVQGNNI